MEGEYPRFKSSYLQEELAEALQLGPDEFDFVFRYRSDHNRHGIAILLKSLLHLGISRKRWETCRNPSGCSWVNNSVCCGITAMITGKRPARPACGKPRNILTENGKGSAVEPFATGWKPRGASPPVRGPGHRRLAEKSGSDLRHGIAGDN